MTAAQPITPFRMVALGDSLTEGLGDPHPDPLRAGAWRGWAALLADSLRLSPEAVDLRNLATSGARAADVRERQIPAAREHRPHLATVIVGVNDTLRASYDIHALAGDLDAALGALAAEGSTLLTACLPDPGRMLRLPGPLARPLARRMHSVNQVVHALSAKHGALHLHVADSSWVDDPRMWSVDRLHPSERGHRALACEFHALLSAAGEATGTPPDAEPLSAPPTLTAQIWWMATRGTRWVLDRCTDLLPDLLRLAVAEALQRGRGAQRLDREAARRTAEALQALHAPHVPQALHAPQPAPFGPATQSEQTEQVGRAVPIGSAPHGGTEELRAVS
ncbi:SGNH/GDSL hydrolase family protein [Streptacidiphilus sp. EB129]|uniref:SGNH/GDSL hydrolase family protein n=1 Tax=Streptacidiphilus sp. EB129 TaxID=3156262 RepID=UPI0035151D69